MGKRQNRHNAIKEIIRSHRVRTQAELATLMTERGYTCTQATISRDVQEIGLVKGTNGCYVLAEELRFQRFVADLVQDAKVAGNLVVVHTHGGSAGSLAAAIDAACLRGVLGTVAGDDTIFVAVETPETAREIQGMIIEFSKG